MVCKFCKSDRLINNGNDINGYKHLKCEDCELEFFISEITISNELYENDSDYSNDLTIAKDFNSLIQWNHLKAFDFIKEHNFTSIIDLGAYNGFFVKFLIEKKLNAFGYDFNNNAVKFGVDNYDLKDRLTIDLSKIEIKKFECVTAFEIIEHLENPDELMEQVKNIISDNGYLIISSPNNQMMWRPPLDSPPHHVLRINPQTFTKYLDRNGFDVIKIHEQMSSFDLVRNYMGVFFRDKKSNSLKGGNFKDKKKANFLKNILNKIRPLAYIVMKPIDMLMYILGFRYISQVIVAKKKNEKN
jgi:2-polyprenyl-3-methyl-5-hydroxy-6-metoxy-1,4-benzoquinol methylase